MIIIQLRGGLGNQLFQYAVGKQISINSGLEFKLDTNSYRHNTLRKYELMNLKIEAEQASCDEVNQIIPLYYYKGLINKVENRYFRNILKKYYLTIGRMVEEQEKHRFDPKILTINKDTFLLGYWHNEKYFDNIKSIIKQEIQLKDGLASPHFINVQKEIQKNNSISVHVRRGDYLHTDGYNICTKEYYSKAMAYIIERVDGANFFVFSDDLLWVKNNIEFPKPVIFVEGCSSDCEELILMSACSHHIIANSTFSWWGAWLGLDACIVVSPITWFTVTRNMYDFIPETWVRLE